MHSKMASEDENILIFFEKYQALKTEGIMALESVKKNNGVGTYNFVFKCLICLPSKSVSCQAGSMSNVRRHVKMCHSAILSKFESALQQTKGTKRKFESTCSVTNEPAQKQMKLFEKPTKKPSKHTIHEKVKDFVISTYQPFTVVQEESFRDLVKLIDGETLPQGYRSLLKSIDEDFQSMKATLVKTFSSVDNVCITTDAWTANHKSFAGYTASWFNEDLTRENAVLAVRRFLGSHTFDSLAKGIDDILREFGIQNKTTSVTTDGATNYAKSFACYGAQNIAGESAQDQPDIDEYFIDVGEVLSCVDDDNQISLPRQIRCMAHSLALVAKKDSEEAFKDQTYRRLHLSFFGLARKLWNLQDRSTLQADKIRGICGGLFRVPGVTRWNSVYDSVLDMKNKAEHLDAVMDALQEKRFTAQQKMFMEEYLLCTGPIAKSLDILQGDKNICLGHVLPLLVKMDQGLSAVKDQVTLCKPLAAALLSALEKRFSHLHVDDDYILASVTIPKLKTKWLRSPEKVAHAIKILKGAEASLKPEVIPESQSTVVRRERSLFDFDEDDSVENVVDSYLCDKSNSLDTLHRFPSIKKLFLKYNTSLPSSASVERLFSLGSHVLTPTRNKLMDSNFEKHLLLKANKRFIQKN